MTVVIPGDLHPTEPGLPNHAAAPRAVEDANELVRPDFVQFIGDNVQDGTDAQFALFGDLCARLRVPWFALVGDHDAQGDPEAVRFRAHVGHPCGSVAVRVPVPAAERAGRAAGGVGERAIEFAVAPTGRYTAGTAVGPLVTSTAFC